MNKLLRINYSSLTKDKLKRLSPDHWILILAMDQLGEATREETILKAREISEELVKDKKCILDYICEKSTLNLFTSICNALGVEFDPSGASIRVLMIKDPNYLKYLTEK